MTSFSVVASWQERPLATPEELHAQQEHQRKISEKQGEVNRLVEKSNKLLLDDARAHAGDYFAAAVQQQEWKALLKDAKPVGGEPLAIADRAARVIEAEDFTRGNVLKDATGYGQGIGVIYNKGELPNVAEYEVPIETAGIFQLEIRYAAAAARGVQLSINGDLLKSDAAGRVTGSWNPDTQTWEIVGLFPLKAGLNTIRLERAQPFPHIDKLLLVPGLDAAGKPLVALASPADGYRLKSDIVEQWFQALEQSPADPNSPFAVWHAWRKEGQLPAADSSPLAARFADLEPTSSSAIVARYGKLFAEADEAWKKLLAGAAKPTTALEDPALESMRKLLYDPKGPLAVPKNSEKFYPADEQAQLATLQKEVKALQETLPKLPETMAVSEDKIENLRVHLRGSHLTLGESVAAAVSTRLFHGGTGSPRCGRKRPPATGRLACRAPSIRSRAASWSTASGSGISAKAWCARPTTSAHWESARRIPSCSTGWRAASSSRDGRLKRCTG